MRILKKILKYTFYILLIPIMYLIVSLLLSLITVNKNHEQTNYNKTIFLNTNGIHLDVIIPVSSISKELLKGLNVKNESYMSFGWGEENFYLNTPTWGDLTFKNAFSALFLKSNTLIHLTRYHEKLDDWVKVKVSDKQLELINKYILKSFEHNDDFSKVILEGKGYSLNDDFYKANGSYSCFYTCNTWVNSAFKKSGLRSCFWTPFDFRLINIHKKSN